MPFYDADDAAIYYEISGEGRPLILLHGYALNGLMWSLQKPAFESRYQLITVDLRGFGQSSCGARWSGSVMAEDVKGLIKSLDLRDIAIVGFSMSGPVAFRIALAMPDRISRLIFVSSILPSAGKTAAPPNQRKSADEEIEILKSRGVSAWADKTGMRTGPLVKDMLEKQPGLRDLWESILMRHNPDYLAKMLQSRAATSSPVNWRERLKEVTQPTLIIAGKNDRKFLDASRNINRQIPNSQLTIIEGAGHMVNIEKSEEFNQAVMEWLG
jgi:pimeloyl-ACP methyl ester carboxylesterase